MKRACASARSRSTCGRPCSKTTPRCSARSISAIEEATCNSVLDGMPSVIVQLPPSAMRSTIVTSAPSAAAVGRRRLDARLPAAATAVILAPAPVELALLPGLVLRAHDPEDEVEQPDE